MRAIDPTLSALMATGNGNPTISARIYNNAGTLLLTQTPQKYKLTGTDLDITIPVATLGDTGFRISLERGLVINGINVIISTSKFYVQAGVTDFNLSQTTKAKCALFPSSYISIAGDVSYRTIITNFCAQFGKTATFKRNAAPFWDYQFLPTGKNFTTNNASSFLNLLRQKYFIFCCDNGNENVLFYNALDVVNQASDYNLENIYRQLRLSTQLYRNFISRDENNSVRTFGGTDPIHNLGFIKSTESQPATNRQPLLFEYNDIILDLKYQDGDSIDYGGDEPIAPALITETFDPSKSPSWSATIQQNEFFANTAGGALPSTIEQSAPYTPLSTTGFDDFLDTTVNNLQAFADWVNNYAVSDALLTTIVTRLEGRMQIAEPDQGEYGPPGPPGNPGAMGAQGPMGMMGPQGETGEDQIIYLLGQKYDYVSMLSLPEIAITATATAQIGRMHLISGTSADYTVALPPAAGNANKLIAFRVDNSATKLFTLDGNASETIDGATTRVLWASETCTLLCDGSNWFKVHGRSLSMLASQRLSANQTGIVTATLTKITIDQADTNFGSMCDTTNKRINIRRAGSYGISAQVYFGAFLATRAICAIYVNGVQVTSAEVSSYNAAGMPVPQVIGLNDLVAGDYLELYCYQNSGANQTALGATAGAACFIVLQETSKW